MKSFCLRKCPHVRICNHCGWYYGWPQGRLAEKRRSFRCREKYNCDHCAGKDSNGGAQNELRIHISCSNRNKLSLRSLCFVVFFAKSVSRRKWLTEKQRSSRKNCTKDSKSNWPAMKIGFALIVTKRVRFESHILLHFSRVQGPNGLQWTLEFTFVFVVQGYIELSESIYPKVRKYPTFIFPHCLSSLNHHG